MFKRLADEVAYNLRRSCHPLREVPGRFNRERRLLEEKLQEPANLIVTVRMDFDFLLLLCVIRSKLSGQSALTRNVPVERKVVRQNPGRQTYLVTVELCTVRALALFNFGQWSANVFGFDMTKRNILARDVEVGRTARNALWFIRGDDSLGKRLQKGLERRSVRVLRRVTVGKILA